MTPTKSKLAGIVLSAGLLAGTSVYSQSAPFGSDEDVAYANLLWSIMEENKLAGPDAINAFPYEGIEPHGSILETFFAKATVNGYTGDLIVKRNYGPAGVSIEEVVNDYEKYLGAITIMFQREEGYDPENQDWFWVRYLPDGTVSKNPNGMQLAGRVAKGSDQGCIACHVLADGNDFSFATDSVGRGTQ